MMQNILVSHLLAAMIHLAAPGHSPYSRSVMPECGDDPKESWCAHVRVCSEPGTICDPPTWSKHHRAWTRQENAEEGAKRYIGIAESIARVSEGDRDMADKLLTTAFWESRFRKDVETGVGEAAYGDCSCWDARTGKRLYECVPGANRVCRAGCMMQININTMARLLGERISLRTLAGSEPEKLDRCVSLGARVLGSKKSARASFLSYGGLFVNERVSTFENVKKMGSTLPQAIVDMLGIDPDDHDENSELAEPDS